jgi:hypothetical protein
LKYPNLKRVLVFQFLFSLIFLTFSAVFVFQNLFPTRLVVRSCSLFVLPWPYIANANIALRVLHARSSFAPPCAIRFETRTGRFFISRALAGVGSPQIPHCT